MTRRTSLALVVAIASCAGLLWPCCSREDVPVSRSGSAPPIVPAPPSASGALPGAARAEDDVRVRVEPTSHRTRVVDLPFPAVDVVAGAAPSREFVDGTLVFAKTVDEGFALVEWDPVSARTLREVTHLHRPGNGIQVGSTCALTRTGSGFAYATTGDEDPSPIELWFVGQDFAKQHHRVIDVLTVDARRLSLHASGETLALAHCERGEHHITTFDVPTGNVVGERKLGRKLALCVGYTTPLSDVRVVGTTVWSVSGGVSEYQAVALSRDLRRVVRRYPIPTPGFDSEARESAIDRGTFPRFDVTPTRMAWNTRGELRVSALRGGTPIWKGRVDPTSIGSGPISSPEEMDFPMAIDPKTGAALLGDGTWFAPDGAETRVFRTREEQPDYAPIPIRHRRRVAFAHGRGVFLGVSPERATLVLVDPN